MLEHGWQDVRFAARLLRRSPMFTAVAAASLAIGIGANTTIFTIVNGLLVRPRPGLVETGLVDVGRTQDGSGFDNMSYPNYLDYREASHSVLQDLAAFRIEPRPMSLATGDTAIRIYGQTVSGNYFDVLGVRPAAGRFFRPDEDQVAGKSLVAVASHKFWQAQFGGDPSLVGRTITLNGQAFTIVGIAPEGFTGTMVLGPDVWVPIHASPNQVLFTSRASVWLMGVGRLAPGVTIAQAQAALGTVAARLEHDYPDANRRKGIVVLASSAFPAQIGLYVKGFLSILMGLVGLVLLIASVNVAGMLLARAAGRRREIAVRLAIGAGRGRLVRQLLTESLLLFLMGGGAGLALALRLRNLLVGSQIALALLLVVAAGLFLRALQSAGRIDPGFDPTNVELASLDLSLGGLDDASGQAFSRTLLDRVRALPGVESACLTVQLALDGSGFGLGGVAPADHPLPNGRQMLGPDWNIVTPGFFETMGIRLVRGRAFLDRDRQGAPLVAIINETLAKQLWPGEDPIGRRLVNPQPDGAMTMEVVGVERDRKYRSLGEAPRGYIYVPLAQRYLSRVTVLVKRAGGSSVIPALRAVLHELNPNLPIIEAQALSAYVGIGLLPQRIALSIAGSLGLVGLLLAAIGIYGVTAYTVSRRTREIGIRMALGARPGDVQRLVLAQGARLAGAGILAGLAVALVVSRLIASLLYGVGPGDPITYGAAAIVFAGMTLAASWAPARRAAAVDPMRALRDE